MPVSREPLHHVALQNKFIRLLDVWVPPGDTSQYHIHSTPSVFIYLSNNLIGSQVKGEGWNTDMAITGKAWYRSFDPDTLVHRVGNLDRTMFHVNDIEILSPYNLKNRSQTKPLPFTMLFQNEKTFAYQLTGDSFNKELIKDRGPIVAELTTGSGLSFYDAKTKRSKKIDPGNYLYIAPGSSFYFIREGTDAINLVLFEFR